MKRIVGLRLDEERALYGLRGGIVEDCLFEGPADGESALKECRGVQVRGCRFHLRYPFWHVEGALVEKCEMSEGCRAAMWYDRDMEIVDCEMNGIKALRACEGVKLRDCRIVSPEFGWKCDGVAMENCSLTGEYPFLDSKNLELTGLTLNGKYSFQYVENMVIRNSVLKTKDAFWHAKNVTVYDSVIEGEYLAWYSENLRLVRCRISGTQPLCYCRNLVLEDCVTEGCDLSFEKSEVRATIRGHVLSVKNPINGFVRAGSIGQIVLDEPTACEITQENE